MDLSKKFFNILQSIDYYVGHLPKDLFANEEQHPDLQSIFMWFINNVSPKSNCVTPEELKLYTSISSKYDHYFSVEKVTEAINKFYDESTKDSIICSTDLEYLEKKIYKSQQELNDLNVYGTLYEKKNNLVDREISLLKEKENCVKLSYCNAEKDLESVSRTLTNTVDAFGFGVKKLNDHIIDSMKNEEKNLIQLASKNLMNLISLLHVQIFEMAHTWFNEENSLSKTNHIYSFKIKMLILLCHSITDLNSAVMIEKSEVAKLNIILNNISAFHSYYYENNSYLHQNGLDITDFLAKYIQPCKIIVHNNEDLASIKYDDLQSCLSEKINANAKQKYLALEIITHLHDTIDHYILLCDVLWCLMQTSYGITNLSCELVLRCTEILDKMINDIQCVCEWNSNQTNKCQLPDCTTNNYTAFNFSEILNFQENKYNIKCSDDIKKLSVLLHEWKNKFNFRKTENFQLAIIEQKIQTFNNKINDLIEHEK